MHLRRGPPAARAARRRPAAAAGGRAQGRPQLERGAAGRHAGLVAQARRRSSCTRSGGSSVRQQVLPLGIRIDRFSGAELASAQRYDITQATVGSRTDDVAAAARARPVRGGRVPEPDRRREDRAAVVRVDGRGRDADAHRGQLRARGRLPDEARREDLRSRRRTACPSNPGTVGGPLVLVAAKFGAAAHSALQERFAVAGPDLQVGAERFVLARVEDLAVDRARTRRTPPPLQAIAGEPGAAGGGRVMSAGYQFLPWVRSGAATAYTNADALGPVLKRADGKPLTGPAGRPAGQRAHAGRRAAAALRPGRRDRDRPAGGDPASTRRRARPTSSPTTWRASSSTRRTSRGC